MKRFLKILALFLAPVILLLGMFSLALVRSGELTPTADIEAAALNGGLELFGLAYRDDTRALKQAVANARGADVLVLAAGLGNGPALAAVKARNAYMVGMDADQRARFPGHVLTSVLKHGDAAVYDLIAAAASGKFQGKKILVRDLANGGVDITDPAVFSAAAGTGAPPDLQRRVQELRGEVLRGGVRLPSMRARTLCDCL